MNLQLNIKFIAAKLNGRIIGNSDFEISGLNSLEDANETELSFFSNPKYESQLYGTKAGLVLLDENFDLKKDVAFNIIRVQNAYLAFAQLMAFVESESKKNILGVEEPAFLHPTATIGNGHYRGFGSYIGENSNVGENVKIYPQVFIGKNVKIGDNSILNAGVKIYDGVTIGSNCIIHSGAVVGSDGFGFAPHKDGSYLKIPQLGNVIIEDDVEIGANTTIDRATLGNTIIKKGVKLDNLVQIAHNVSVGQHSVMAAQSGIAGSGKLGDNCVVGGQVAIVGHLSVANGTKIGGQSGVTRSVLDENTEINGTPAHPLKDNLRSLAIFRKLPDLFKRIEVLEKIIK